MSATAASTKVSKVRGHIRALKAKIKFLKAWAKLDQKLAKAKGTLESYKERRTTGGKVTKELTQELRQKVKDSKSARSQFEKDNRSLKRELSPTVLKSSKSALKHVDTLTNRLSKLEDKLETLNAKEAGQKPKAEVSTKPKQAPKASKEAKSKTGGRGQAKSRINRREAPEAAGVKPTKGKKPKSKVVKAKEPKQPAAPALKPGDIIKHKLVLNQTSTRVYLGDNKQGMPLTSDMHPGHSVGEHHGRLDVMWEKVGELPPDELKKFQEPVKRQLR
jgi:hypothetical protein